MCGTSLIFLEFFSEIAVDPQTRTSDQTFEGVPNPNRPPVPVVQPRPYLVPFFPILPNHQHIPKTKIVGALLVASGLMNSYMKFYQDWTKMTEL